MLASSNSRPGALNHRQGGALAPAGESLLVVEGLAKRFPVRTEGVFGRATYVPAVDGVSFSIAKGESLGLVGESGCGKTTLARLILRLERADAGRVTLDGKSVLELDRRSLRFVRRSVQLVPQDPGSSIDPRYTAGKAIAEPLAVHRVGSRATRQELALSSLEQVGLDPSVAGRRIHEFSGGQRQRISIARALVLEPLLLIADEPTSSLDVLVQAQILNLLRDLQERLGLAMLFISHNLAAVRYVCDRIAVMYAGRVVEIARTEEVFSRPAHPYTKSLVDAVPTLEAARLDARTADVETEIEQADPMGGCRFARCCPNAQGICSNTDPSLVEIDSQHWSACHFPMFGDRVADAS